MPHPPTMQAAGMRLHAQTPSKLAYALDYVRPAGGIIRIEA